MPEYHALRLILAALEALLVYRVYRTRLGYLLVFAVTVYFNAVADAVPAQVHSALWFRAVWLPLAVLRLVLSVGVSLDVFRFLRVVTYPLERVGVFVWSLLVSLAVVLIGWYWNPANWFQAATTIRQYVLLCLAVATSCGWAYVRILRPVDIPRGFLRIHAKLWCVWLWVVTLMSSTGEGGLARLIGDWQHYQVWRTVNDIGMAAQVALTALWIIRMAQFQSSLGESGGNRLSRSSAFKALSTSSRVPSSFPSR